MGDVGVIITATKMQLSVRSSKAERVNAVKRALEAKDVRNALSFIRSKGWSIDETKAEVAMHKLKDGKMLAVGFPVSEKAVLVYYEYSGIKIKSEARVYVLNGNTAKLEFISVNGSPPVTTQGDCPPGTVECPYCNGEIGLDCVATRCGFICIPPCTLGPYTCALCLAVACPAVMNSCCQGMVEIYCCPTP